MYIILQSFTIVSSRVSALPWNIDPTHVYLTHPPLKKNSKSVRRPPPPPFMSNPALKILENLNPPSSWNVPLSKKGQTHFLKKQKTLFLTLNINTSECWNMNIQFWNLKIKGELGVF